MKTFTFLEYDDGDPQGEFTTSNDLFTFVTDYVPPAMEFTFLSVVTGEAGFSHYVKHIDLGVVNP